MLNHPAATASDVDVIVALDDLNATISRTQRVHLSYIALADKRGIWIDSGCRDMAHWVSLRFGISFWKARRWIAAAHALETLPRISDALCSGTLSLDKVVELSRFATPETEAGLIPWACKVTCSTIRQRGELEQAAQKEAAANEDRSRRLDYWYFDDGKRFGLYADLPAEQGALVAKALDRIVDQIPAMPGEEDPSYVDERRADALVMLASQRVAGDGDPDRATLVVHAPVEALQAGANVEVERGPVLHPAVAARLACDCRLQVVLHGKDGNAVGIGHTSRNIPRWLDRQLRYRDRCCTFPGCSMSRFVQAHHIVPWPKGPTDLDNLVLVCFFHHKLVHDYGWSVRLNDRQEAEWFRSGGHRYIPGPAPPRAPVTAAA